jgi:hypothetical protein
MRSSPLLLGLNEGMFCRCAALCPVPLGCVGVSHAGVAAGNLSDYLPLLLQHIRSQAAAPKQVKSRPLVLHEQP